MDSSLTRPGETRWNGSCGMTCLGYLARACITGTAQDSRKAGSRDYESTKTGTCIRSACLQVPKQQCCQSPWRSGGNTAMPGYPPPLLSTMLQHFSTPWRTSRPGSALSGIRYSCCRRPCPLQQLSLLRKRLCTEGTPVFSKPCRPGFNCPGRIGYASPSSTCWPSGVLALHGVPSMVPSLILSPSIKIAGFQSTSHLWHCGALMRPLQI